MKLLIRSDASINMGTGHVMRCLALAQAWKQKRGDVIFAMAEVPPGINARLQDEGMEVMAVTFPAGSLEDACETVNLGMQIGVSWIVVDGYQFNAEYQRCIKDSNLKLVFIDDYGHAQYYFADIVLNQNVYAHEALYKNRDLHTSLLLGTPYVFLRQEFTRWKSEGKEIPPVARKVLVTMGGSDPENVTLKIIQALELIPTADMEIKIIVGAVNPHLGKLKEVSSSLNCFVQILTEVRNMPKLMEWAEVAVSAAGSSCWELAFMKVPTVAVVLADNQYLVAEHLGRLGVMVNLGSHIQLTPQEIAKELSRVLCSETLRAEMSFLAQKLVDGQGVSRLLRHMDERSLSFRRVQESDQSLLWEWRNDPTVRALSFSAEKVEWEHHVQWFASKLKDPNCIFFMLLDASNVPIGQVRYDIEAAQATIAISLAKESRGKGYGSLLVQRTSDQLFASERVNEIHAYVKEDNQVSRKAFIKAGFKIERKLLIQEQAAIQLILHREELHGK
jgi:UDP-2,4-diacetamido-2,4,6-trideoxy-beta-L-altropyranose hydrolase